ncbi:MAG: polysaccharide deacetylase family protein [Magnetococcales bacterium]|nr:polysaccharide deacetylase family protein [Magnetococcales bacterium]NGZ05991.1 polysaccharide deacetylase family protein [Magnetococcales bacterium]
MNPAKNWPARQQAIENLSNTRWIPPWWLRLGRKVGISSDRWITLPPGVYILIYHSVVDPDNRQEWERHYQKGETSCAVFARQLEILLEWMTPLPLSAVPKLWKQGDVHRPYLVVTFDDGYANNRSVADPVVQSLGIRPTVFVNGAFATHEIFFRVLAAWLIKCNRSRPLATALQAAIPEVTWSPDPETLFYQTKWHYHAERLEQTIQQVFMREIGPLSGRGVHLSVEEVRELQNRGWEIGNHTWGHRILSGLNGAQIEASIQENATFWEQAGVGLIPFLAYPLGRACDVSPAVEECLQNRPDLHGIFGNGGVNLQPNRMEWLRFSLGSLCERTPIREALSREVLRTRQAFSQIKN